MDFVIWNYSPLCFLGPGLGKIDAVSMTDISKITHLAKPEREALMEFSSFLIEKYRQRIKLLELFGSKARGDARKDSDLDLLIVTDRKDDTLWDLILDFIIDLDLKYDLDISPRFFGAQEFSRLMRKGTPFMNSLKHEGIEIWGQ